MKRVVLLFIIILLIGCTKQIEKSDISEKDVYSKVIEDQNQKITESSINLPTETPSPDPGERENPIDLYQPLTINFSNKSSFQISVIDIIRGKEAWNLIYAANMFNDTAPVEMEYLLARIGITYLQSNDENLILDIDKWSFKSVSNNRILEVPGLIVPKPELEISLFPDGYADGYIAFLIYQNDPQPLIMFSDNSFSIDHFFFSTNENTIEPTPTFEIISETVAASIETDISPTDGMVMVKIPAGEFIMGNSNEEGETSTKEFFLDEYWIDQTEVTNKQYKLCENSGACKPPMGYGSWSRSDYYLSKDYQDYPVIQIDWERANSYCSWAGRRLPTEAEWEKAARGINGEFYPWGDHEPNNSLLNFNNNNKDTTKVGSFPEGASPYGVLDIAGNVWEWVSDWYQEDYLENSQYENPKGPESGFYHVMRGGSLREPYNLHLRKNSKSSRNDLKDFFYIGFRCAK